MEIVGIPEALGGREKDRSGDVACAGQGDDRAHGKMSDEKEVGESGIKTNEGQKRLKGQGE